MYSRNLGLAALRATAGLRSATTFLNDDQLREAESAFRCVADTSIATVYASADEHRQYVRQMIDHGTLQRHHNE
jgi:Tfp pilus assembly protein PilX